MDIMDIITQLNDICISGDMVAARLFVKKYGDIMKSPISLTQSQSRDHKSWKLNLPGGLLMNLPGIDNNNSYSDYGLLKACCNGHLELAKLMIDQGATHLNDMLGYACRSRHTAIVELLLEQPSNFSQFDLNEAFECACGSGQFDMAELLIQKGARNFTEGIRSAYLFGHTKLGSFIFKKYRLEFNFKKSDFCASCMYGSLELVKLIVENTDIPKVCLIREYSMMPDNSIKNYLGEQIQKDLIIERDQVYKLIVNKHNSKLRIIPTDALRDLRNILAVPKFTNN